MTHARLTLAAVAATCAVAGAGAGAILSASAAGRGGGGAHAKGARHGGLRALRRAVHAELTVPTRTGFAHVTLDRGFVTGVAGNRLTLSESTRRRGGRTVTLTIPAGARILDNRRAATLADLRPGQRVAVVRRPARTVVRAHDRR